MDVLSLSSFGHGSFSRCEQLRCESTKHACFYLCVEVSRFISQLCSHVYTPDTALENAWFLLLRFQTSDGTFLPGDEYLVRLNLTSKVAAASKARAQGMHFGKTSERSAMQATTETVKTDFINDSQLYIQFLINEVLQRTGLSTKIVMGG